MRAALLEDVGRLTMIEAETPTIEEPDQLLIQVKRVVVCGSEVHAFCGTHPYRRPPAILGHETAGQVVAIGPAVTRFKEGDRVMVDPLWPCGQCAECRAGYPNLCFYKKMLGTAEWPGAFGEYIVAPEPTIFPLPDNMSYLQGSLIEPLMVGVHVARMADLKAGESVAVLGTGSIGGMVTGVCHALGAGPIITADIHQHCLDAARERLGATHDFLLPDVDPVDAIREVTGGRGVDLAVVAADDVSLVAQAVEMTKPRGRVVLVALLTEAPLKLRAWDIISKEISVIGSIISDHSDVHQAIELATSGRVDVEAIVTHVLPIEETQRGVEMAHTKDDGAIKVTFSFEPA
jgi:L-iditol 2-dehydrogenase